MTLSHDVVATIHLKKLPTRKLLNSIHMRKIFTTLLASAAMLSASASLSLPASVPSTRASELSGLPIITEQPDGNLLTFSKNAIFFGLDFYGQMYSSADYGRIAQVVDAPDGKVYFKNPFCGLETDSWLMGESDGETITVTFPQKIYTETYQDWEADPEGNVMKTNCFYAFKLLYSNDGTTSKMEIDMENPTITFSRTDSGIVMDGDAFIGLLLEDVVTDENSGEESSKVTWTRYADSGITLSKVDGTPNALPEGVATEQWVMASEDAVRFVGVAIDGDDIYLQGVLSSMPESVIKGKIDDGKVTFRDVQYIGEDLKLNHFAYFIPADVTFDEDPEAMEPYIYTPAESVSFDYDTELKAIYSYDEIGLAFSSIPDAIFLLEGYMAPQFMWQDFSESMTPDNPEILDYYYYEDYGFGALSYAIPNWSTDGRVLDTNSLFYNIFLDDEILVLYPDEYPDLLEPMENIPAGYEDSSIYFWGDMYEAMVFATGFDRIGVRSLYINADGTKTYSDIVYNDGDVVSALKSIGNDMKEVVKTEYFAIDGRRLAEPVKGSICVMLTSFADGTVKTTKILKR